MASVAAMNQTARTPYDVHHDFVWVLVLPYSARAVDQTLEAQNFRLEVVHRLEAARLKVTRVNSAGQDAVHVLVSCPLERLEEEAEKAQLRKKVRANGGLAPFCKAKRHLFGHKVLDWEFFSARERQELVLRIMLSNKRFKGAGLDIPGLLGTLSHAQLSAFTPLRLRCLLRTLRGGTPVPEETGTEEMVAAILASYKEGILLKALLPLHDPTLQELLAQSIAGRWWVRPGPIETGGKESVFEVLRRQDGDHRAAKAFPHKTEAIDGFRDYFGEGHTVHMAFMSTLAHKTPPLAALAVVLYLLRWLSTPPHLEYAILGCGAMIWFQALAAAWQRELQHLQHQWGTSQLDADAEAIDMEPVLAPDGEQPETVEVLYSAEGGQSRDWPATLMTLAQVCVLLGLCACAVAGYGLVRMCRYLIWKQDIDAWQVAGLSAIDTARVYLLQFVGERVLSYLESLDDETLPAEAKQQWRLAKRLLFEMVNHFSAIAIAVAYQAFASGAKWLLEPPSCFSPMCQNDIELQVMMLFCIKFIGVPLVVAVASYVQFKLLKRKRERNLGPAAEMSGRAEMRSTNGLLLSTRQPQAVSGGGGAVAVQPGQQARAPGSSWLFGRGVRGQRGHTLLILPDESPADRDMALRRYARHYWELRAPLDLLLLLAFVALASPAAPLLPVVLALWIPVMLRIQAWSLTVETQRAPQIRGIGSYAFWAESLGWIGVVGILCTSVTVMFITPDVQELIEALADTYRAHLIRNQAFGVGAAGDNLECLAGICLDATQTVRAEGSLYWIIWVVICTVGFSARLLSSVIWRTPSYWLRRTWQLEAYAQALLGLTGSFVNEDEATQVYEEYQLRYNAIHIDPDKFEKGPT